MVADLPNANSTTEIIYDFSFFLPDRILITNAFKDFNQVHSWQTYRWMMIFSSLLWKCRGWFFSSHYWALHSHTIFFDVLFMYAFRIETKPLSNLLKTKYILVQILVSKVCCKCSQQKCMIFVNFGRTKTHKTYSKTI